MKHAPRSIRHLLSLPILIALSSCRPSVDIQDDFSDPWDIVEIERGTPIRLAVIVDQSSPTGLEELRGAQMAVENYGRIDRSEIELVELDSPCIDLPTQLTANSIVEDTTIVGVIGFSCSLACITAGPILDENHVTIVSSKCGAVELTEQMTHRRTFLRTIESDTIEANAAAEFAFLELGARRAAILHDDSANTRDLATGFEVTFTSLGGDVVANEVVRAEFNPRGVLGRLAELDIDVVYAPLPVDLAVQITLQYEAAGLVDTPMIGSHDIWNGWYVDQAGFTSNGVYATGPILEDSSERQSLREQYIASQSSDPTGLTYLFAYDAAWMVLQAIDKSAAISSGGVLQIGRLALNDALYETTSFEGASGSITCSQWGDCGNVVVGVGQVRDGSWAVSYIP